MQLLLLKNPSAPTKKYCWFQVGSMTNVRIDNHVIKEFVSDIGSADNRPIASAHRTVCCRLAEKTLVDDDRENKIGVHK